MNVLQPSSAALIAVVTEGMPGQRAHSGVASIATVADAWPTLSQVFATLTFQAGFNTSVVVLGTTLLGIAAGIIGVFALLRKRALMADAISHATLPGVCLAFLLAAGMGLDGRSLPVLLLGASATGVVGVLAVQGLLRHTRLEPDASIGIVLSVFFGAGVVLLSVIQSSPSGNAAGLNHFIYGQTAALGAGDAALMGFIALAALGSALLFLKEFALVCFNDDFAQVDGWPVSRIDLLMMALVVIVTVAGLQAVGLILVVALLIIPPVAARFWTERLSRLVLLAGVIGGLSGYLGASLSALLPRKPAGSVIVLTSGVIFAISLFLAPARGVLATLLRRVAMRFRIAAEHILEAAVVDSDASRNTPTVLAQAELDRLARLRGWPGWFRWLVLWRLRLSGDAWMTPAGLELSPRGRRRGARVNRNHRLWEQYLIRFADIAPGRVDWSADHVEHVLPPSLVAELERTVRGSSEDGDRAEAEA